MTYPEFFLELQHSWTVSITSSMFELGGVEHNIILTLGLLNLIKS